MTGRSVARVGLHCTVSPAAGGGATWYGRGPHECYVDRQWGAPLGRHSVAEIEELHVSYIVPGAHHSPRLKPVTRGKHCPQLLPDQFAEMQARLCTIEVGCACCHKQISNSAWAMVFLIVKETYSASDSKLCGEACTNAQSRSDCVHDVCYAGSCGQTNHCARFQMRSGTERNSGARPRKVYQQSARGSEQVLDRAIESKRN